jgi:hypothetical protein
MKKIFTTVLLAVLFASCEQHDAELIRINIVDGIRRSTKMPLTHIANDILFIPLETLNESIVAKIVKILFADDYIVVIDDLPQISIFNKTGKFIRKLGVKGDGKTEFLAIHFSTVTNEELFVWDFHLNTTFCYNLQTGKCIKTHKHKFIPSSVDYYNDSLLVYYCSIPLYSGVSFSRLHFLSLDFEKCDSIWYDTKYSELNRDPFYEGRVNTYIRNKNMYIWDSNLDTVFYLNNRFERKPGYQFFLGRHALSEDGKYNIHYVNSMKDDEYMITKIMETDKFFFIEGIFGRRYAKNILYDKVTKKVEILSLIWICKTQVFTMILMVVFHSGPKDMFLKIYYMIISVRLN